MSLQACAAKGLKGLHLSISPRIDQLLIFFSVSNIISIIIGITFTISIIRASRSSLYAI